MRTLTTLTLALALAGPLLWPPVARATQFENSERAREGAEGADKELNKTYKLLAARLDPDAKRLLLTAEVAWIKFRDAQCASEADWYRGGSLSREQYARCRERMSKARVAELKEAIDLLNSR